MLVLEGVSRSFGGKAAVSDVDLEISPGSFVGVIGRSGAGKSTLLRMLNRLIDPSEGRITFDGMEVSALRGRDLRAWRARCAMIFQQFNLVGRLDVLTNVLTGRLNHVPTMRSLLRMWSDADKAIALAALEQFDVAGLAAERAENLSGGQQQRVAIARALVQEPDIILADEPIASLDPRNTGVVMDALLRINKHYGITVLCNLHSLEVARSYCDRLVGMAAGRVVFDGPPAELTESIARELYGLEAGEVMAAPREAPACANDARDRVAGSGLTHRTARRSVRRAIHDAIQPQEKSMFTRRHLVGAAALGLALAASGLAPAAAQDWKSKYPELTLGVIPAENASGTTDRWTPLTAYLSKQLGVPVKLRVANDYAAVIEGQRAGNIHLAFYGPASFSRAIITGVKTDPLVNQKHETGVNGYYSVTYVRADSPYRTLQDLKGKTLALVDPNSTSGNQAPRFFMRRAGVDVDTFFGKTFFAGSHENAVLALAQGTADAAANFWNSDSDSNLTRMISKGLVKDRSGKPLTQADFRIVFKSDFLPEGPFAVLDSLPSDLKGAIKQALLDLPKNDKTAFDTLSDGKDLALEPVSMKDYQPIIDMVRFNDEQRKRS